MSDTPRTDQAEYECVDEPVVKLGSVDADFARQLERELNAANERIKRLEEAGDELDGKHLFAVHTYDNAKKHVAEWYKAKEAKP